MWDPSSTLCPPADAQERNSSFLRFGAVGNAPDKLDLKRSFWGIGEKMVIERDQWINERAYALWEQSGCQHGRDHENWCRAAAEYDFLQSTRASSDGAEVLRFRSKQSTPSQEKSTLRRSPREVHIGDISRAKNI